MMHHPIDIALSVNDSIEKEKKQASKQEHSRENLNNPSAKFTSLLFQSDHIFNSNNNTIFSNSNKDMFKKNISKKELLIIINETFFNTSSNNNEYELTEDIICQLFSLLITSRRPVASSSEETATPPLVIKMADYEEMIGKIASCILENYDKFYYKKKEISFTMLILSFDNTTFLFQSITEVHLLILLLEKLHCKSFPRRVFTLDWTNKANLYHLLLGIYICSKNAKGSVGVSGGNGISSTIISTNTITNLFAKFSDSELNLKKLNSKFEKEFTFHIPNNCILHTNLFYVNMCKISCYNITLQKKVICFFEELIANNYAYFTLMIIITEKSLYNQNNSSNIGSSSVGSLSAQNVSAISNSSNNNIPLYSLKENEFLFLKFIISLLFESIHSTFNKSKSAYLFEFIEHFDSEFSDQLMLNIKTKVKIINTFKRDGLISPNSTPNQPVSNAPHTAVLSIVSPNSNNNNSNDVGKTNSIPAAAIVSTPVATTSSANNSISNNNLSDSEIETIANSYFNKIYTEKMKVEELIATILELNSSKPNDNGAASSPGQSSNSINSKIFHSIIHSLIDEYRFFSKYPDKELVLTGRVYGMLIKNNLFPGNSLPIALKYVLEALKRDINSPSFAKMFTFGMTALNIFEDRLQEWLPLCIHLVRIPHFSTFNKPLFDKISNIIRNSSEANSVINGTGNATTDSANLMEFGKQHINPTNSSSSSPSMKTSPLHAPIEIDILKKMQSRNIIRDVASIKGPSGPLSDKISFILNNLSKRNYYKNAMDLMTLLEEEHFDWFANLLIINRVSTQANLHSLYLSMLMSTDSTNANNVIPREVDFKYNKTKNYWHVTIMKKLVLFCYHHITKLLVSPTVSSSSSERSMLRNIGLFLGEITLSMNKPLLDRHLNLKELLCYGYEHGLLIVVSSLVCKILEGTKSSKIFKLPNPWLSGVLGLVKELYELEDLKTNIKFEFQVLLKNIELTFEQIPNTACLLNKKLRVEKSSSNSDYNINKVADRTGSMTLNNAASASSAPNPNPGNEKTQITIDAKITIPNIDNFVKFPGNFDVFFDNNTNKSKIFRQYVVFAVDRAIIETVNSSSNINIPTIVLTVKSIVLKDFAVESNEQIVRAAAHSMVQSLVELFIPATARECLKRSIYNYVGVYMKHVSAGISTDGAGQTTAASESNSDYEEIISFVSHENVDIGLNFIIKMIVDKTKKIIDLILFENYAMRRRARDGNVPFSGDFSEISLQKYSELPEFLRLSQKGIAPIQLKAYDDFRKLPQIIVATTNANNSANLNMMGNMIGGGNMNAVSPQAMGGHAAAGIPPVRMGNSVSGNNSALNNILSHPGPDPNPNPNNLHTSNSSIKGTRIDISALQKPSLQQQQQQAMLLLQQQQQQQAQMQQAQQAQQPNQENSIYNITSHAYAQYRSKVASLIEQWLKTWQLPPQQSFIPYLHLLHNEGVLSTEDSANLFFRTCVEIITDAAANMLKAIADKQASSIPPTTVEIEQIQASTTSLIDSLVSLFLQLISLTDMESKNDVAIKEKLVKRIIVSATSALYICSNKKKSLNQPFDQKPFIRLFSLLQQNLPDMKPVFDSAGLK